MYGHRGDGIYQSLSCSARIIHYAISDFIFLIFLKRDGKGFLTGLSVPVTNSVFNVFIINDIETTFCPLPGGGHRCGEGR